MVSIQNSVIESKNEDAMMETKDIFRYTTYDKNKNPYGLSLHSDNPSVFMRTITEFLATIMKQSWEADGDFWYQRDSKNIEETNEINGVNTRRNNQMNINSGENNLDNDQKNKIKLVSKLNYIMKIINTILAKKIFLIG